MKKAAVFGIGQQYVECVAEIHAAYDVVCLADNDRRKWGVEIDGYTVLRPSEMVTLDFDCVLVIPNCHKMEIITGLLDLGLQKEKIVPWMPDGGRCWKNHEISLENGYCLATFDDVAFYCRTSNDFLVMKEIFICNTYGFWLGNEPIIALDIGMNVGLASLFLAHFPNVEKVYAFEPFPKTYQSALKNFAINPPHIRDKIIPHNVGLGKRDAEYSACYDPDFSGSVSTVKSAVDNESDGEIVIIREAGRELRRVLNENPGKRIVAKVDVEGSEYDVVSSMEQEGILENIYAFVVETHNAREEELKKTLMAHGFSFFDHSTLAGLGMIYAFRARL